MKDSLTELLTPVSSFAIHEVTNQSIISFPHSFSHSVIYIHTIVFHSLVNSIYFLQLQTEGRNRDAELVSRYVWNKRECPFFRTQEDETVWACMTILLIILNHMEPVWILYRVQILPLPLCTNERNKWNINLKTIFVL